MTGINPSNVSNIELGIHISNTRSIIGGYIHPFMSHDYTNRIVGALYNILIRYPPKTLLVMGVYTIYLVGDFSAIKTFMWKNTKGRYQEWHYTLKWNYLNTIDICDDFYFEVDLTNNVWRKALQVVLIL